MSFAPTPAVLLSCAAQREGGKGRSWIRAAGSGQPSGRLQTSPPESALWVLVRASTIELSLRNSSPGVGLERNRDESD